MSESGRRESEAPRRGETRRRRVRERRARGGKHATRARRHRKNKTRRVFSRVAGRTRTSAPTGRTPSVASTSDMVLGESRREYRVGGAGGSAREGAFARGA